MINNKIIIIAYKKNISQLVYIIFKVFLGMGKIWLLAAFISLQSYSQKIKGYVFYNNNRIENASINNITQGFYTISDAKGYFELEAKKGDSVVINSISFKNNSFKVKKKHIANIVIYELNINELEEVEIINYRKLTKTLNSDLNSSIKQDMKKHPSLYQPYSGNIGYILHNYILTGKKKKRKKENKTERILELPDLIELFEKDEVINKTFLLNNLEIPREYHRSFLDYLTTKNISSSYLKKEKKLDLINLIIEYSLDYKAMIID